MATKYNMHIIQVSEFYYNNILKEWYFTIIHNSAILKVPTYSCIALAKAGREFHVQQLIEYLTHNYTNVKIKLIYEENEEPVYIAN